MPVTWMGLAVTGSANMELCGYKAGTIEHDAARLLTSRLHHPKTILRVEPARILFVNEDDQAKTAYLCSEVLNEKKETTTLKVKVVDGFQVD